MKPMTGLPSVGISHNLLCPVSISSNNIDSALGTYTQHVLVYKVLILLLFYLFRTSLLVCGPQFIVLRGWQTKVLPLLTATFHCVIADHLVTCLNLGNVFFLFTKTARSVFISGLVNLPHSPCPSAVLSFSPPLESGIMRTTPSEMTFSHQWEGTGTQFNSNYRRLRLQLLTTRLQKVGV